MGDVGFDSWIDSKTTVSRDEKHMTRGNSMYRKDTLHWHAKVIMKMAKAEKQKSVLVSWH